MFELDNFKETSRKKRGVLEFDQEYTTTHTEQDVKAQIESYYRALGYQKIETASQLVFERGSRWRQYIAFSPRTWFSRVRVDVQPISEMALRVTIRLWISTKGQTVLQKETDFWKAELTGLYNAIHRGIIDTQTSDFAAERAKWFNCSLTLVLLIAMFFSCVIIFMISSPR